MKDKIDSYTWTKQMMGRDKPVKLIRKLFIKRYSKKNVPFLESVQRQFNYWD